MRSSALLIIACIAIGTQANVCKTAGYDSDDAYYYDDSDNQGSFDVCSKLCLQDSKCKSFAYNKDACMMFAKELKDNFEADDTSSDIFYDRSCLTKSSSSLSHTDTTKPATTLTTTTKSSSSVAATSSSPAVPSDCGNVPNEMVINSFYWFNSTHNCDCAASHPDVGNGTGCLDNNGQWCDPNTVANCTHCGIGVCMTGLPPQPVGYGPPDVVKFGFTDGSSCQQGNPQGFKPFEVGQGHLGCGGSWPQMGFTASSEEAKSKGQVSYSQTATCGPDADGNYRGYVASYAATIDIECTHDAQRNATCGTPEKEVRLPLTSFTAS